VLAARSATLAAVASAIGNTDFHAEPARQRLLLIVRLLTGNHLSVIDGLNEYGKFLERDSATESDARLLFGVSVAFARGVDIKGASVAFAQRRRSALADGRPSTDTAEFVRTWCGLARISPPDDA
jgi:hypothetical protein